MTTTAAASEVQSPASTREKHIRTLQTALFTIGAVLMPSGLIAVGFGWYGAAHARYAYDQFPYLLSGGLLGVCLTTLGGFLYFGAWQAKAARDQKQSTKQVADAMVLVAELVRQQLGQSALAVGQRGADRGADLGATPVVAGTNGASVHRRDCGLIAHRDDLRPLTAADADLAVCRVCAPDLDHGTALLA